MNEDVSMIRSQCHEKGDYVEGVLTCTHSQTHTWKEWTNEANECEWEIVGWTLFVSRYKVCRQSLLFLCTKKGDFRVNTLCE